MTDKTDETARRGLAYNAISNFDAAPGTKRTPEQFADTEGAIMAILAEIIPVTQLTPEERDEEAREVGEIYAKYGIDTWNPGWANRIPPEMRLEMKERRSRFNERWRARRATAQK